MLCWEQTYGVFLEAVFVRGHVIFCWNRPLRGHIMFRGNINIIPQTRGKLLHWVSLQHFPGLRWWCSFIDMLCNALLVSTDLWWSWLHWEKCQGSSCGVLATCCFLGLVPIQWGLAVSSGSNHGYWFWVLCLPIGLACHYWFMFDVLDWTADILKTKIRIIPKKAGPYPPFPINLSCPLPF